MNYFLFKKDDKEFAEYLINDFKYIDGYVYYTAIDGIWPEKDCYFDPNLQLKRTNLQDEQIEIVGIMKHKEIYQQLSELSQYDIRWLNNIDNQC